MIRWPPAPSSLRDAFIAAAVSWAALLLAAPDCQRHTFPTTAWPALPFACDLFAYEPLCGKRSGFSTRPRQPRATRATIDRSPGPRMPDADPSRPTPGSRKTAKPIRDDRDETGERENPARSVRRAPYIGAEFTDPRSRRVRGAHAAQGLPTSSNTAAGASRWKRPTICPTAHPTIRFIPSCSN